MESKMAKQVKQRRANLKKRKGTVKTKEKEKKRTKSLGLNQFPFSKEIGDFSTWVSIKPPWEKHTDCL